MKELKKSIKDRESYLADEAHRYKDVGNVEMYERRMAQLYNLKVEARRAGIQID